MFDVLREAVKAFAIRCSMFDRLREAMKASPTWMIEIAGRSRTKPALRRRNGNGGCQAEA
jgi:hypothetical protein